MLREEFETVCEDDPQANSYRPATYIVISNTGQMTATILRLEVQARNYFFDWKPFRKLYRIFNKRQTMVSHSDGVIIDQTRKIPTIIESGHSWLAIVDAQNFRDQLEHFPYVSLELKASHKIKPIRKRIKLKS